MAAQFHSHDEASSHETGGSGVSRSRFLRALDLFSEAIGHDRSSAGTWQSSVADSDFDIRGDAPFFCHQSDLAPCQEMLTMDGIDLPDFESLDALPSMMFVDDRGAEAIDEFSDDPDQLWFDETVTTMFMENTDKPKIDTALVEPRMETKAWPLGVIAEGLDAAFTGHVERDEDAETAEQLKTDDEMPSAPTPDTFLITAKDEVDIDSADEVTRVPVKPRPLDDVSAPAQDLPFAAMLDAGPAAESGKRGFGVKLAPGWKPLRGQKVNPPSKAIAANSETDAVPGAEQEWVEATLRAPRQDSILDGFGEFLEEQVILSAAIDEPDFKALASSFDGSDAGSSSSDVKPEAAMPEPPTVTAPSVKTEWIDDRSAGGEESKPEVSWLADGPVAELQDELGREFGAADDDAITDSAAIGADQNFVEDPDSGGELSPSSSFKPDNADEAGSTAEASSEDLKVSKPASASDALPKSSQPISAPSLVVDDHPRGFSASMLYGAASAGSFFEDLEDGSAPGDDEKVNDPQPMVEDVVPEPGGDLAFPKASEASDIGLEADGDSAFDSGSEAIEIAMPWSGGEQPDITEVDLVSETESSVESVEQKEVEIPEVTEADPGSEAIEIAMPWSNGEQPDITEVELVSETESSVESVEQKEVEIPEVTEAVPIVSEQGDSVALPADDEIPVTALGYGHSRTNPALLKHGVSCPACGVNLQIQSRYVNIEGKCPACSEMIVARQRGMFEPIAELAEGQFPSFDRQPDLEPSDVPGGTVLSQGTTDEEVTSTSVTSTVEVDVPATPSFDPFSNPNHALKKVREAAAGGVWGPTSGKGLS